MIALLLSFFACGSDGGSRELPTLPELPPKQARKVAEKGPERPVREVVVALTGAVRGEVEVCGCPTTPYGGFARRMALFEALADQPAPVFVVDAGEMLVKGLTGRDEVGRLARAESVLELAEASGLDAWAASPVDLVPGGLPLLARHGALAANWAPAGGALAAARVVERGGVQVGFVGLAAPAEGVAAVDAVAAVKAAMADGPDAWFVLSNADTATNRAVAEGVPGLAAVLATQGDDFDPPVETAGAPIVEAPGRGRYVTLVHTTLATDPRPLELVDRGIWRDIAATRYGRDLAAVPADRREAEARRDHARLVRLSAGRAVAYVESVPLSSSLDGNTTLAPALARFRDTMLAAARQGTTAPTAAAYATGSACATCHQDRLASWSFDAHARALESLARRNAAGDPECVACHTTGFGLPGGFAAVEEADIGVFRDVQCEACHGPMQGHDGRNAVRGKPISEATCRTCHDEANSPKFDYAAYLAKISCTRVSSAPDAASTP